MSLAESLLLGLLQGITEFLPVSSSGHLVLAQALLGVEKSGITFEVAVHLATALAVAAYYRRRLWRILVSLRLIFAPLVRGAGSLADEKAAADHEHLRLAWLVALGTVPAVIAGLFFKDFFERFFYSPHLVSIFLLVTGALLFCSRLAVRVDERRLLWWAALVIGVAQAAAILPGISRSGATIAAGLLLGLKPGEAAEFSFLLALPAVLGAGLLEFLGLPGGVAAAELAALLPGFAAALVSGYLAIVLLLKVLLAGRFDRFAYYCWAVGIAGLVLL